MSEWISVKDRYPTENIECLFIVEGKIYIGAFEPFVNEYNSDEVSKSVGYPGNFNFNFECTDLKVIPFWKSVSYWMPLPELPEEE